MPTYFSGIRLFAAIGFALFMQADPTSAQSKIQSRRMAWYSISQQIRLNEKYFFVHEWHERHFIGPEVQHLAAFRGRLHRKLSTDTEAAAGVTYFYQSTSEPNAAARPATSEWRPHLELTLKQNLPIISIQHRYRSEARFYLQEGRLDFSNLRHRYQLSGEFPLLKKAAAGRLKIRMNAELMINSGEKIIYNRFDQIQFYAGASAAIRSAWTFEVGLMNRFQQRSSGIDFFDTDILRLQILHRIGGANKQEARNKVLVGSLPK